MDEIKKLNDELSQLKNKYKNKCEKLKKSNEKVLYLTPKQERRDALEHARYLEGIIFRDLTDNLDKFIYEIDYEYDNKKYSERKIESFGSKWIKKSLLIYLAKKHNLVINDYEIEIINAKKLW